MNVDDLMKKVNESYAKSINSKLVFGEPVEKDGVTIISVAKVTAKVGEGTTLNIRVGSHNYKENGSKDADPEELDETTEKKIEKLGYGIDAKMNPMGYIEIKDGNATYHPIIDINRMGMAGICFAGFAVFLFTRMVTRVAKIVSKNAYKHNDKKEKHDKK